MLGRPSITGNTQLAGHKVLIVGRGQRADIRLVDASVSRLHAELVIGGDGSLRVADRSSANGTWVDVDGSWERVTQRRIVAGDRLRFGSCEIIVSELMHSVHADGRHGAHEHQADVRRPIDGLPRRAVRRDPVSGAVVKG